MVGVGVGVCGVDVGVRGGVRGGGRCEGLGWRCCDELCWGWSDGWVRDW